MTSTDTKYTCSLCGRTVYKDIYQNEEVQYVMCENCSLISLYPRPTEEEYTHFYEREYQSYRHSITNYEQAVEGRKAKGFDLKKKYMVYVEPYLKKNSRVLEIGSGWGTFLKLIADTYKCDVRGVEISELAVRVAREHYGLSIEHKTLNDFTYRYKGEKFDVIIMMQVLEHIVDPNKGLKQLASLLSNGGVAYIAVPNTMQPNEPLDRFFHFEHVNYFSPYTLMKILEKNGLKIIWNKNNHDINIIVARAEHPSESINNSIRKGDYTKYKIRRKLENQRKKYAFLRIFKKGARLLLTEPLFNNVRKIVVSGLKKLGIIKV